MQWHTALDLGFGGVIFVDDEIVSYTTEDVWENG